MFGFSLAELIIVLLAIIIFVKPKDLPEVAHFLGRCYYRIRKFFNEVKRQFSEVEKEIGLDDLKYEASRGIAEEKAKIEDDLTVIVDLEGNEHKVPNLKETHPDFDEEEIEKLNNQNSKK
jgi:Sec-independent protein translocase protein TatA